MFKYLPRYIADKLFPYFHRLITEKNAQEKKLAKFKRYSVASIKGHDRRKTARRITDVANDAA